ncbi:hypothetical protein D3C81_1939600 [compost metagenome]
METVDELEAQGNQQRHAQQQKRRPCGHHGAQFAHVVHQAVGGEQQADAQYGKKHHDSQQAGFFIELWLGATGGRRGGGEGGGSHT